MLRISLHCCDTWYLTSQCHHPCGYAKSRQTDLEVKNHHSNQAKVV